MNIVHLVVKCPIVMLDLQRNYVVFFSPQPHYGHM